MSPDRTYIETLRAAAAPAARAVSAGVTLPAFVAGVGVVDKIIAVGLLSITAIILLIGLIIVG